MLIFCEECGQKLDIFDKDGVGKIERYKCEGCGETLTVRKDRQTASLFSPERGEGRGGKGPDGASKAAAGSRVLVVDDSGIIRKALGRILEGGNILKVVGEAVNGEEALELIPQLDPDVVTLDINMPVMDGLTTLKHMMIKSPKPAVMISTLTLEGASVTFDALKYGAVDFIPKPSQLNGKELEEQKANIVRKVALAARVETGAIRFLRSGGKAEGDLELPMRPPEAIFCLGSSEGGYSTLLKIVPGLRPDLPVAVLAVLYAEPTYVDAFARYLDDHSPMKVRRAKDKQGLLAGYCYLASGEEYLTMENRKGRFFLRVTPNPFPGRRGAINMLMMTVAEAFGEKSAGAVLSGMGEDGVEGLREIVRQGGIGIVQDPRTCLCKDMVLSVLKSLRIDRITPDHQIAAVLNGLMK